MTMRARRKRLLGVGLCGFLVLCVAVYSDLWPFSAFTDSVRQFAVGSPNSLTVDNFGQLYNALNHYHQQQQNATTRTGDKAYPANPTELLFRTHNVTGESPEILDKLYRRFLMVDTKCQGQHTPGKLTGIFTHDPSRVAYCFLPKTGCTFWIRVFSYLHDYTGDAAKSPWDISRLKVHSTRHSHGVGWASVRDKVQDYLRFMFVRHPFSRLWSAYLDKLFLPDFWSEIGVPAVRKLRGQSAKMQALRCGNDLTFSEFVEYSLNVYEPHWEPIYLRCDPCQFKPAVIGSMKTFADDSLFILRRMNLEWVLKDVDHKDQEEKELNTLITYNFERLREKKFYHSCINDSTLTQLLWKTFQMNGYISKTLAYPAPASGVVSVKQFQTQVIEAYRAALSNKSEMKTQKSDFLREALASLSPKLMEKVEAKYKQDMIYFGFNETNY